MEDLVEHHPLPTVREVIALPELRSGAPELLAGSSGLDREVRWAHVFAGGDVAGLLDGGELILTTGAGWPGDERALGQLAEQLTTVGGSGVAAIVLELGRQLTAAPPVFVARCDEAGVPLIVLREEVRFVQITQRVHQRILAAQNEALQARAEVHAMLTELGLNRSPVDYVVEQLAATLDAPVVLAGPSHGVVAFAGLGSDVAEALAPWMGTGGAPTLPPGSEQVAVEARGTRWGTLTALPGPAHAAGRRTVLELGAFALALGRLADAEGDDWLQLGSKRVFETLLGGRYRSDAELATQLEAAGLPLTDRAVLAATVRGTGDFRAHPALERAMIETALRRAVAPEGRVLLAPDTGSGAPADDTGQVLLALISLPTDDPRAASTAGFGVPPLAARLARELDMLVPGPTPAGWRAHLALGAPERRLRQLIASLEQLRAAGRLSPTTEVGRVAVQLAERQPLAHLIRGLAGHPELQHFAEDALGPLIAHDAANGPGHSGDLLRVLAAYLAHPSNRSLAANRARLSRSVFYQRLTLIEELLGVDLADGETIATLTVALLARPA
ncbi:MAG: PucR family transcriptional regulator [Leucobacter sp.]|nr:PucR family transcriptional regulator [Leucobacter sp.]